MIFAVTGPTHLEQWFDFKLPLRRVALDIGRPEAIVSGCAIGVDTRAVDAAIELWPTIEVWLTIPDAFHNEEFVARMKKRPNTKIFRAPPGRDASDAYMKRNDLTAKKGEVLLAFPDCDEQLRSGTWATVRRFRKLDKPIYYFPLY